MVSNDQTLRPSQRRVWWVAGSHGTGAVAESSHLHPQTQSKESQLVMMWESSKLIPKDTYTYFPARPHLLTLPQKFINWRSNMQIFEPMVVAAAGSQGCSYSNHHNINQVQPYCIIREQQIKPNQQMQYTNVSLPSSLGALEYQLGIIDVLQENKEDMECLGSILHS